MSPSLTRKAMYASTYEGMTALIVMNTLGGPFLTGYLLLLGANSQQIGFVLAIQPLANTLQIVAAFVMQKLNNRKLALTVLGGLHRALWVATGLIPLLLPQTWWIASYIALYSLSFVLASGNAVIWSSLISDTVPTRLRGRYFGIRNALSWAAGSAFLLIAGQIMDHFPDMKGFSILFMIAAVATVLNIHGYMLYANPPFEKSQQASPWSMLLTPFKDKLFIGASLYLSLFIFVQNIAIPLFSYVMLDIMKISYSWVSILTTVQMLTMMVAYYVWGNWNAKYSSRTLLYWTLPVLALSCLVWGLNAVMPALVMLVAAHIFLGFGLGGYQLLSFNYIIGDTPKSERPMYIAVFSALTGLTGFLGPMAGGAIYAAAVDWPYWMQSFGIAAIVGFLLLLIALLGRAVLFRK